MRWMIRSEHWASDEFSMLAYMTNILTARTSHACEVGAICAMTLLDIDSTLTLIIEVIVGSNMDDNESAAAGD